MEADVRMKQTVEIQVIEVYWRADRFEEALNDAYAEGWYLHSWRVTEDKYFYAVLHRGLPDDLRSTP